MSTNTTVIEIVKFKADGLTEMAAQTKTYSGQVKEANTYLKTMAALINDPRYVRHTKLMNDLGDATERLGLKMRNTALAARLSDGSAVKQLGAVTKMNAQYDQMQQRIQNIYAKQSLADGSSVARARIAAEQKAYYDEIQHRVANIAASEDLASGVAVKRLRTAQQLSAQADSLARITRNQAAAEALRDGSMVKQIHDAAKLDEQYTKITREAEMIAKYGERTAKFLGRRDVQIAGKVMTGVGVGVGVMAATGIGLAKQGFQGTVEQAKFDLEMKMLSRELAAIFKPVMELLTRGARFIRRQLEGLSETGQNVAMTGMLLGGTAASAWALRGAGRMMGFFGGAAGAVGAGTGAAGGAGATALAQAGGAAAGNAANSRFTRRNAANVGAGLTLATLAFGAIEAPYRRPNEKPSGYYSRMREQGEGRVMSSIYTAGAGLRSIWENPRTEEQERTEKLKSSQRRQVMIAGGGFEETGSGYERIQAAIGQVGGDTAAEKTALNDTLKGLKDMLVKLNETLSRSGGRPLTRPGG